MKRFTFLAIFFAIVLGVNAQYYMHVWYNDSIITLPVLNVDSITFSTNPSVSPDIPDTPVEPETPTKTKGVFSVSADKQVTFSPGNLQYHPYNNKWRFAENQWDYIGEANGQLSATYDGWLDLFGWGTGNAPTKSSELYNVDYQDFIDWGTSQIGSDAPNTWRALSKDEWMYIFYNRENAQSLFALGSVNGINGTIILPDNWTTPAGVSFVASATKGLSWQFGQGGYYYNCYYNSTGTNYGDNTYTSEQWSEMEQAGAVFLPASGRRRGTWVYFVGDDGRYWSSTEGNSDYASCVYFHSNLLDPQYAKLRNYGLSVRLVKDTVSTPSMPSEPDDPYNGHEYVDLGLPSGTLWATCNVGANAPEEYGDYFAWGEVEPKEIYDWSTYKWCALTYHSATSYTAYLTKYCTLTSSGHEFFVDNKTLLEAADDAAVVNWGGVWRMPTKEEQDELREQCTWTMTTINGINGYIVTSKINGYTDKSIFLPETGSKEGATYGNLTYGYYWSSSLKAVGPYNAFYILFDSDDKVHCWDFKRSIGLPVRPVCIKSDDMK